MMKKIFSVAILAISLVSMPIMAQDKSAEKCGKEQTCDKGKGKKSEKRLSREAEMYAGMNLTDSQKEQLAALKENMKQERRAKAEANREERSKQKEMKAEERKAKKEAEEKTRREYLKQFRNIVGDQNYIIFLENQYIMQTDAKGPKKPAVKGDMKVRKGERGKKAEKADFSNIKKDRGFKKTAKA